MAPRWASLGGWTPDPERPGFLCHPQHVGTARTPDGRWWSQKDIDRARVVVDEVGRVVRLDFERSEGQQAGMAVVVDAEAVRRIHQAAREVLGHE